MNKALYSVFVLLIWFNFNGHSTPPQDSLQIEDISITHPSSKRKADGQINVQIKGGNAPFSYYLSDSFLINKETILQYSEEPIHSNSFTVIGLAKKEYYLFIKDSSNTIVYKKVILDTQTRKNSR